MSRPQESLWCNNWGYNKAVPWGSVDGVIV